MTFLAKTLRVASAISLLLLSFAHAQADEKKQNGENGTRSVPAASAEAKAIAVEVRFSDNSLLKLKLEGERLEFLTPYGKLSIPVSDVHRIDFATRVSPEANKLFSASGAGKLYIFDGKTYDLITTVDFPGGADNLRYDAATKRVYVACGDEKTGAIATVDAMTKGAADTF